MSKEAGKAFFFEEKQQKAFAMAVADSPASLWLLQQQGRLGQRISAGDGAQKFFGPFSQKRTACFLPSP